MTTLLSHAIQPPLLTLLSSTSEPALSPIFSRFADSADPNNSFISVIPDHLVRLESSSSKRRTFDQHYISQASDSQTTGNVCGRVIHIQSPNPTTTYIQAGDKGKGKGKASLKSDLPLGVELPWIGLQVKGLGHRGMAFEFGVVDVRGKEGVIRISSYKSKPSNHPDRSLPLIHLPLDLPEPDRHTLTPWLEIKINLASLMPLFRTLPRSRLAGEGDGEKRKRSRPSDDIPSDQFGHVTYVRVYANCRLRRICFSANGEQTVEQAGVKEEWALFAHSSHV